MVKHNKLDADQLAALDACLKNKTTPDWIRGYAGSGKSVLLIHALIDFLALQPNASVCLVVYTHALKDMLGSGIPDSLGQIPIMTYHAFKTTPRRYDLILVDEVQDLPPDVLKLLKAHAGKLIVAGDEEQTLYPSRSATPAQIMEALAPAQHTLDVLYRITARLRRIVQTILPDSKITEARMGAQAVNVDVALVKAANAEEEIRWVSGKARDYAAATPDSPAAILLPQKQNITNFLSLICREAGCPLRPIQRNQWEQTDFDPINRHLAECLLPFRYLGNGYGELKESNAKPLVYLMTYHSAKGLDFETVFLPFLDKNTQFRRDDAVLDRTLFFVACTRSRRNLFLSHHSPIPHPYVQAMPQDELKKFACSFPPPKSTSTKPAFHF
ncbi:MAG: 3'-5' exonuclease [Kiritimatiellia bacterium]